MLDLWCRTRAHQEAAGLEGPAHEADDITFLQPLTSRISSNVMRSAQEDDPILGTMGGTGFTVFVVGHVLNLDITCSKTSKRLGLLCHIDFSPQRIRLRLLCLRRRCGLVHPNPNETARPRLILLAMGRSVWCRRPFDSRWCDQPQNMWCRSQGQANWLENEVAACVNATAPEDIGRWAIGRWPAWSEVDTEIVLILRRLDELEQEIQRKGGIRRARPYIRAQRRRLSGQLDRDPP